MTGAEILRTFNAKGRAGKWRAKCPCHKSRGLTLAIARHGDRLLFCCHAGCTQDDVLAAVGLSWRDVVPQKARLPPAEYKALQKQRRAEEAAAYRARIRDWIRYFRENGYTPQQYDDDVAVACAAAGIDKAPWPDLLRVSMERITAASIGGIR